MKGLLPFCGVVAGLFLPLGGLSLWSATGAEPGTTIPWELRGEWRVVRNLSEPTLGCFAPKDAEALLGLRVSIAGRKMAWGRLTSGDVNPERSVISSYMFLARFGKLPEDLGLRPRSVMIIEVHPSQGIPVNALVSISPSEMLIDACNMWLEAMREPGV